MNLLPEVAITPNTIHHMDLFRLCNAMGDASVDMILCDAPYGVLDCKWDSVIPIEPMWTEFSRIIKPRGAIVLTASQPFTSRLVSSNYEMFKYSMVWVKTSPTGYIHARNQVLKIHEDVLVFSKGAIAHESLSNNRMAYYPIKTGKQYSYTVSNTKNRSIVGYRASHKKAGEKIIVAGGYPNSVLNFASESNCLHPTQKPLKLFEYLIKTYTLPNALVFDPTCGSGTTALAAKRTDRRYICGDSDAGYVNIARNRLGHTLTFEDKELKNGETQLSLF